MGAREIGRAAVCASHNSADHDRAVTILDGLGLPRPYGLLLPKGSSVAFMAQSRADQVETTRVVYLDKYSGAVLQDVGFAQFGPAAKAIEWGIAVHRVSNMARSTAISCLAAASPSFCSRSPRQ